MTDTPKFLPGEVIRTPFEPSGLVRILRVYADYVEVEHLDDHPRGYRRGTWGCYFKRDWSRTVRTPATIDHQGNATIHRAPEPSQSPEPALRRLGSCACKCIYCRRCMAGVGLEQENLK